MGVVYHFLTIGLHLFVYNLNGLKGGDFTDEICFRIPDGKNIQEFYHKHTGLIRHKEVNLGGVTWYCAKLNQSTRVKPINPAVEVNDVQKLKDTKEVLWVEQQKVRRRETKTLDPKWNNSWQLNGDELPSMNIIEAWDSGYTGKGIVIAILDDGFQTNHSDLDANVDTVNSIDIFNISGDTSSGSSHATQVAGLLAAERDNDVCSVGVAYQSKILSVKVVGTPLTDSQEAQALSHYSSNVDIYSSSWGPTESAGFEEPGTMAKAALYAGTSTGRGGKGVIYTWAAGNGGTSDNCNADGYVNSIYTIGITSVEHGKNAWYSTVCSAAMTATYGGSRNDKFLTTTTTSSECTSNGIEGSSYSTPIASGIIALTLQANSNLTWRDIQHLIVLTSNSNGFSDTYYNWTVNAAGKVYSQVLGFGLMNAEDMVTRAKTWNSVPAQQNCTTSTTSTSLSTYGSAFSQDKITVATSNCSEIKYLEHVTARISFSYNQYRGNTELHLISPGGTESHILSHRPKDSSENRYHGSLSWTFMSVHFWRESPAGTWTLRFRSSNGISVVTLKSWSLTFYGTKTDPLPCVLITGTNCENNSGVSDANNMKLLSLLVIGFILCIGLLIYCWKRRDSSCNTKKFTVAIQN